MKPSAHFTFSFLLFPFFASAEMAHKVISAARVETAPRVDGVLDDAAWGKAECRRDFEDALGAPLSRSEYPAELRLVTDGRRLYLALKFTFKELPALVHSPWEGKFRDMDKREFAFDHLCEIFLDPGRTLSDYYQYLVRADNTCAAHYKMDWSKAKRDVEIASKVSGTTWTLEFSFPAPGLLETGATWGFHFSLRDIGPIGDFCSFSGPSNTPQLFTPLLIGTYEAWFADAFAKQQARIDGLRKEFPRGETARQLDYAQQALDENRKTLKADAARYEVFRRYRAVTADLDRIGDQLNLKRAGLEIRSLVKDVDFNEWGWVPIDARTARELLAIRERGDEPYFDLRGPMMLMPIGRSGPRNNFPFPCGRASSDAVKGTSLHYAPQKTDRTFFQHGPFYGTFHPGRRYRYEYWVKGRGTYRACAELRHVPANGGGGVRYTNRPFAAGELPSAWTKVSGVFVFPDPPAGRTWENDNGFTFYAPAGTELYLDEIKVWELD